MRKYKPPTLAIRLNAEEKEALRTVAGWMGVSMSEAIRRMVRDRLAQIKQNPPGAADSAG
jgi:antitoxin component of RelBE/YafQ-DinJ toxin-antitoxin module